MAGFVSIVVAVVIVVESDDELGEDSFNKDELLGAREDVEGDVDDVEAELDEELEENSDGEVEDPEIKGAIDMQHALVKADVVIDSLALRVLAWTMTPASPFPSLLVSVVMDEEELLPPSEEALEDGDEEAGVESEDELLLAVSTLFTGGLAGSLVILVLSVSGLGVGVGTTVGFDRLLSSLPLPRDDGKADEEPL